MRKYTKLIFTVLVMMFFMVINCMPSVKAESTDIDYERDYLQEVFNSDNGLEGTAVKCIYSSSDGFIWVGSYTGLYRYDGTEFQRYFIDDRTLLANDIVQDKNGNLWIGTNGEGIYCFDGEHFTKYSGEQLPDGSDIVNKLLLDEDGILYAATQNGLLTLNISDTSRQVHYEKDTSGMELRDIGKLYTGEKILVEQEGTVLIWNDKSIRRLEYTDMPKKYTPRCVGTSQDGNFYLGTNEEVIIKSNINGEILQVIDCIGLSTINEVQEMEDGSFWVCSDMGVGIMQDDSVKKLHMQINDSVEGMCTDYQGNLWFASSRQGILHLYENGFSDLGAYWGLYDTVNALLKYDDIIYVGTDSGLYGYIGKEQITNELIMSCEGERIRHLYIDSEQNMWISTYRNGLKRMQPDGTITVFNTDNSGMATNRIRCVWQQHNGSILIGTDQGLYVENDDNISYLTDNEILNSKRILDVTDYEDIVYASVEGYGMYEIRDGAVKNIWNKQSGMQSNIIMKVVPSDNMKGVWLLTGEDIYFLGTDGTLRKISDTGIVNARDLLLGEQGDAVVLAGNGIFYMEETELLAGYNNYLHFDRHDGLTVDFTANACNTISDNVVYMCGTTGAVAADLSAEKPEGGVRLFLNEITADGKPVDISCETIILPKDVSRVNIDVRAIDYVHQNLYIGYQLEGMDEEVSYLLEDGTSEVSYTNLSGGSYTYHFYICEYGSNECIAKLDIPIQKEFRFYEIPKIRILAMILLVAVWGLLSLMVISAKEKGIRTKYTKRMRKDIDEELARAAYTDLVTGAYNRNRFEQEIERINMNEVYAFFSLSVNHHDYIRGKYGDFYFEGLLRKVVDVIHECSTEDIELYRISENVFCFWMSAHVELESFVQMLKEHFARQSEDGVPMSLSVGAVYNNTVDNEKITDLLDRCEKMRLLDEKHAEAKFIESKMKLL